MRDKTRRRVKDKTDTSRPHRGKARFAGRVEIDAPSSGRPIRNGTRIVVSLAELSYTKLPDVGKKSELKLEIGVQTTSAKDKPVSTEFAPGLFYHVENHSRLNLLNTVLFDDRVHQHLSLNAELTEVEMARLKEPDVRELMKTGIDTLGTVTSLSRGPAAIAGGIPRVISGILKLNANDQLLKFGTSLFTREVILGGEMLPLIEGEYTVKKFKDDGTAPWVTMKFRVCRVKTSRKDETRAATKKTV